MIVNKMKNAFLVIILISNIIFAQTAKVEFPKKLDAKYWSFDMRKKLYLEYNRI